MKKLFLFFIIGIFSTGIRAQEQQMINKVLNRWHEAAAKADDKTYFSLMTEDGVFVGTDPTENWQYKAFKKFAKPYFDAGKAWSFTPVERHIYLSDDKKIAWFDELLDTQMELCRGSGVLKKVGKHWKIAHYVLSITIPNNQVHEVVAGKKAFDEALLQKLRKE